MSLNIALKNTTSSTSIFAVVTGRADDNGGALCLIEADGKTPYYPPSPTSPQTPLAVNCTIPLGPPGSTSVVAIPHLSGARIWFSINTPLVFVLNPGPSLVEPSVTNPADPNIDTFWGFCELTFNSSQLYANISYVDFVSLPVALSLTNTSGNTQTVKGLPQDGLAKVCQGLQAQTAVDGKGWNQLIVNSPSGTTLRALSPNLGQVLNSSLFSGYFEPYVNAVWNKYTSTSLTVDTQSSFGVVTGNVSNGLLNFTGVGSFSKPSTADIFTCSTGPFLTNTAGMAALTPRISASFNRSTLLSLSSVPATSNNYYLNPVTNHYSRICHATNLDHLGYAFPYDDVTPTGGADQSGAVFDPHPQLLTVTIGGPVISGGFDASNQIPAAEFTSQSGGVRTQPTTDVGGGMNVGWIANGDWMAFSNVDFGTGKSTWSVRVASGAATGISGLVQLVIDSEGNAPIANFAVASTGGWQTWKTVGPVPMSEVVKGSHDVFLTFASGQAADFVNVNWFSFA